MTRLFAAEGGYQAFHLHGGEWFWLVFSALTAVAAVGVGVVLMRGVLAQVERTVEGGDRPPLPWRATASKHRRQPGA